jgi:hypothetical protein
MPFYVAGGNVSKIAYENAKKAVNESMEAKQIAEESKVLSQQIIDGEVDISVARTEIDRKLSELEEQYAPKLNQVTETVYNGIGMTTIFNSQMINSLSKEIEKYKKQRFVQGQATITAPKSNGYFRDLDPFVTVSINEFAQINAPNYDVLLTPISGDVGMIGDLIAYDKTQNGFKVKMTGSAESVTFLWTLLNPNV